MDNNELTKEQNYLAEVRKVVKNNISALKQTSEKSSEQIYSILGVLNNSRVDPFEKSVLFNMVNSEYTTKSKTDRERDVFSKTLRRPFFASITVSQPDDENKKYYIGLKTITEVGDPLKLYVIDWRSPISSLYYTAELGPAEYKVNRKSINVDLEQIRQYKYDNDDNISSYYNRRTNDDFLIEMLSKDTNPIMENIVGTIQAEQDQAIRYNPTSSLIINGIPGSGKTSVALHRIASILYQCKDTIKSNDIIMISPNRTFVEYTSNLLPELGEENVKISTIEELLNEKVVKLSKLEKKSEFFNDILTTNFQRRKEYAVKYDDKFLKEMQDFLDKKMTFSIFPQRVVDNLGINYGHVALCFQKSENHSLFECVDKTLDKIFNRFLRNRHNARLNKFWSIKLMLDNLNWENLYTEFMQKHNLTPSFGVEDLPIMAYFILKTTNNNKFVDSQIKQIVIDEVQDYDITSLQVLKELFPNANFTIVGDHSQNIVFGLSNAQSLATLFPDAKHFDLINSYRSTTEIIKLAFDILGKEYRARDIRHGESVSIMEFDSEENLNLAVEQKLKTLPSEQRNAIIVKNNDDAKRIQTQFPGFKLLDTESGEGFITHNNFIVTAVQAKGLEFDNIILYNVSDESYNTETDRRLLYVSTSRALHSVSGFSLGKSSRFIPDKYVEHSNSVNGTKEKN